MTTLASTAVSVRWFVPTTLVAALAGVLAGGALSAAGLGGREVLVVLALAVGAAIDVRTRRVPNWLTAGAGAFALASAGVALPPVLAAGAVAAGSGLLLMLVSRGGMAWVM